MIETGYRCVPISAQEGQASLRISVVVREKADVAAGHWVLIRQDEDARVLLGAICDSAGRVHEWVELWFQTLVNAPHNAAREARWREVVAFAEGGHGERIVACSAQVEPGLPVFISKTTWEPVHPIADGKAVKLCRDDAALAAAGLPGYSLGTARYGTADGVKWWELGESSAELATLVPPGCIALNASAALMLVRRFAPFTVEEFAEVLGGRSWAGILNARKPFRLAGAYQEMADESAMRAGGLHIHASRQNTAGRLAEALCLKLALIEQCLRLVCEETRRVALPMLNVRADSFRVSLGATGENLPYLWTFRASLVHGGDAIALDFPGSQTRYFAAKHAATASIYRPEEIGVPRRGTGSVRLRKVFPPADGGLVAEGTLVAQDRLSVQPNELLRLQMPMNEQGTLDLYGWLDPSAALVPGEAAFRSVPLQLDTVRAAALQSYEGTVFKQVPYEVIQPLSAPCDFYSLGVLALRVLFAGSERPLPALLDAALSLLAAVAQGEGTMENRIQATLESDERWLSALGPQYLWTGPSETGATLPLELWSRVLGSVLLLFPGRTHESFARDLADAPTLAPHAAYEGPLRAIERAVRTARAVFLTDWRRNEEILQILAPMLPIDRDAA